ncbi:hypothetical protein GXB85_04185 [Cellulomonas sp. APG4]|uniref:hypothetical protein n=1 Tax=Cellulomonas sp. APG4 TaxID=1538656 RepID=UPI00137AC107|nr:hypothetical protein [Cellulomonas sp. APG4]NCT90152.1 hypothetical protein [Cellulomonas sp. APG4]
MSSSEWRRQETDPFARVWSEVKKVREETRQRVNYLLKNAGLSVAEGVLRVTSGRLASEADTWELDGEGNARFDGAMNVGGDAVFSGDLAVPNGSISNDALANPVTFAGNTGSISAASPPATFGVAVSANLTIPAWASTGVVMASGFVAGAAGLSGGSISGRINIAGEMGPASTENIEPSTNEARPVLHQRTLAPSGTTVPVSLQWQGTVPTGSAQLVVIGVFGR